MAGAVAGPAAFVSAWAALGATAKGYDPTRTAISRLAAVGVPGRPAMTAGMVALAAGMCCYAAIEPHRQLRLLAATNGVLTLGIAAVPLGSRLDTVHGALAALGYATLAAIPLAAVPSSTTRVQRVMAAAAGIAAAACLAATTIVTRDGLLQRVGLTVAQAWVVAGALGIYASSNRPPRCLDRKRSAAA